MNMEDQKKVRLASIDIFRALTMFFMIFVNDLFTVKNVPKWMLHTEMHEDGMGFSDVIFPVFLLIVGMSIPFAKADWRGIGMRTIALLIMGVFLVNYEYFPSGPNKPFMSILAVTSFFLIWSVKSTFLTRVVGVAGLILFVFLYPDAMEAHWWGILGLIGWSYLIAAGLYKFSKGNLKILYAGAFLLLCLSIADHSGALENIKPIRTYFWIVESGALPFLCVLGMIASVNYKRSLSYFYTLIVLGVLWMVLGVVLRPIGGISKILATPSWVCICGGIGYLMYAVLFFVVDLKGKEGWAKLLMPAGAATLTCYLIPYYWYSLKGFTGWRFPEVNTWIGIILSLGLSFLLIQLTGLLKSIRLRL
jgi:heparan-alpha-glucosaminide N-acetyltransferase